MNCKCNDVYLMSTAVNKVFYSSWLILERGRRSEEIRIRDCLISILNWYRLSRLRWSNVVRAISVAISRKGEEDWFENRWTVVLCLPIKNSKSLRVRDYCHNKYYEIIGNLKVLTPCPYNIKKNLVTELSRYTVQLRYEM